MFGGGGWIVRGRRGDRNTRGGEGLGSLFRSGWLIVFLVVVNSVEMFATKKRSKSLSNGGGERSGSCCFLSAVIP